MRNAQESGGLGDVYEGQVLHAAARDVLALGYWFGSECSYEKLHWSVAALRAARCSNRRLLELACKSYSILLPWFSLRECRLINVHALPTPLVQPLSLQHYFLSRRLRILHV